MKFKTLSGVKTMLHGWQIVITVCLFMCFLSKGQGMPREDSSRSGNLVTGSVSSEVHEFWKNEFNRLNDRIITAGTNSVPILKDEIPILSGRPSFPYHNNHCLIWDSDRDPVDVVLRRTRALLEELSTSYSNSVFQGMYQKFSELERKNPLIKIDSPERQMLFMELCELRRTIAMANPLLDFNDIIFVACGTGIGIATDSTLGVRGSHWQYMGFQSMNVKGEGPIILSNWKMANPTVRHLLKSTQQEDLRFHSAFDVSYDGSELLS